MFDFTGSENIKNATVRYPAPWRIDEAGLDLFGYTGGVTFPVDVEFIDAGRPAVLKLSLDYAVCSSICLPVKAKAALELPVRSPAVVAASVDGAPENATLADAAAKVPLRVGAADRDKQIAVTRAEGTPQPTWRVRVKATRGLDGERLRDPERAGPDVFVESPQGWYFESRKSDDPNEFLIVEVERPHVGKADTDDKVAKIPLTVTLADRRQSYEFELELDALVTP